MPAQNRIGDPDIVHTDPTFRLEGSPNVFINGLPAGRVGDKNSLHKVTNSSSAVHSTAITEGSSSVYINNKPAGRVGDPVECTTVAEGSGNVFIG